MATFPKTESGISEFAAQMVDGLTNHSELYPSVTIDMKTDLNIAIAEYNGSRTAQAQAQAAAKNATLVKQQDQIDLEEKMKKILLLADHDCMDNPGALEYIGWGERKTPTPLAIPGQPNELAPAYEGPGSLTLAWNKPRSGGAVSSYRIERSDQPEGGGIPGPWSLVNTFYSNEVTLENQPRGIEMQYRVIATNAAGDSMPSNIATVVL